MSRRLLVLGLILVVCLSGVAFAAEEPEYGGTFVEGIPSNWGEMFNPILSQSAYDSEVTALIYSSLIDFNENMKPVPAIAKSWDISEDSMEITFHLRDDVLFHDGEQLTAEDIWFTYRTMIHPEYTGPRSSNFFSIKGAKAFRNGEADEVEGIQILDDYTLKFVLEKPDASFLTHLTYGILPSHILQDIPVADLENAEFNREPVGSGPFVFEEYKSQQYLVATAFEDFYEGRPYVDKWVLRRVSKKTLPVHFDKREVDWTYQGVLNEHYKKVDSYENAKGYTYLDLGYSYIGLNQVRNGIKDKSVRKAMVYGFNRKVITEGIKQGFGVVANGPIPPTSWAYDEDSVNKYNFNQVKAKNILKEAGYIDRDGDGIRENEEGNKLEFDLYVSQSGTVGKKKSEVFQQMMKLIGIRINVNLVEFNSLIDKIMNSTDWDMCVLAWSLGLSPDGSNIFGSEGAWNFVNYENPRLDEIMDKARTTMDIEKRKELYSEYLSLINDELPYIFTYFSINTEIMDTRIRGFNTDPGTLGLFVGPEGGLRHKVWVPSDQRIRNDK